MYAVAIDYTEASSEACTAAQGEWEWETTISWKTSAHLIAWQLRCQLLL